MTPYYDDGTCVIYHGDAREILPSLPEAAVILTDPPYGIGLEYDNYVDSGDGLAKIIRDLHPLMLSQAPVVALTCGIANIHRWPAPRWVLCWYQPGARGATGYWGFNLWQPVLVWGTDPYLKRGLGRRPDFISVAATNADAEGRVNRAAGHPCPKPLNAWKKILVRVCPDEKALVVDPLMGSGVTLRAAKDTGRRAIGIEISERYCEIAASRLAQEVLAL
jgi:DNA modification methylase